VTHCDHASILHRYVDMAHYESSCAQNDGTPDGQNEQSLNLQQRSLRSPWRR